MREPPNTWNDSQPAILCITFTQSTSCSLQFLSQPLLHSSTLASRSFPSSAMASSFFSDQTKKSSYFSTDDNCNRDFRDLEKGLISFFLPTQPASPQKNTFETSISWDRLLCIVFLFLFGLSAPGYYSSTFRTGYGRSTSKKDDKTGSIGRT